MLSLPASQAFKRSHVSPGVCDVNLSNGRLVKAVTFECVPGGVNVCETVIFNQSNHFYSPPRDVHVAFPGICVVLKTAEDCKVPVSGN